MDAERAPHPSPIPAVLRNLHLAQQGLHDALGGHLLEPGFAYEQGWRRSQEFPELFRGQSSVTGDLGHCKWVDRIVTRNDKAAGSVGHHDVAALTDDRVSTFRKDPYRVRLGNAGKLWHDSNRHHFLFDPLDAVFFGLNIKPKLDGFLDVPQRLLARSPLTVATRKTRAAYGPSFVGFQQGDSVSHGINLAGFYPASSAFSTAPSPCPAGSSRCSRWLPRRPRPRRSAGCGGAGRRWRWSSRRPG
jgi:hypothetical protein